MSWFHDARERVGSFFSKDRQDADTEEEFRFHIDMETEKHIRRGLTPAEARRRALISFGGVDRFTERTRDERGTQGAEHFLQDIRLALRRVRRSPGFALVTALTIGLGVAATVLGFVIADAVVFQPLPYPASDRLVRIEETNPGGSPGSVSAPDFLDLAASTRSFDQLVAMAWRNMVLRGADQPYQVSGLAVTPGYFKLLGAQPELGRAFVQSDAPRASEGDVVILSQGLWLRVFSGDPGILGTSIELDGRARTVVGVAPAGLRPLFREQLWVPFEPDPAYPRGDHRLEAVAHLAPGVTLADARVELGRISTALAQKFPDSNTGWAFFVQSFPDWLIDANVRRTIDVLMGAAVLLLLLACTSVSALFLARVSTREREMALRTAMGAGRSRIVRQLLVESVTLAAGGAVVGLLITASLIPVLKNAGPGSLPGMGSMALHGGAFAFALATTLCAGIFFGLAPGVYAARGDPSTALQGSSRHVAARGGRIRDFMVAGQMALAVTLLVGAGLLGATFLRLSRVDPGFRPDGVLAVSLAPGAERYQEGQRPVGLFYRSVLEHVRAIPGVTAAGASIGWPFQGPGGPTNQVAPRERSSSLDDFTQVDWRTVTPGYFRAMDIPLLRGRYLDESDNSWDTFVTAMQAGTPIPVPVMVTTALSDRLWPGESAVGKHLVWNHVGGSDFVVVGVVAPIRDLNIATTPQPMVFLPNGIVAWPQMTLLIRAEGDVTGLGSAVRKAIWEVDSDVPVRNLVPLRSLLDQQLAGPRFTMILVGALAAVALLMATLSLYGVVSFGTSQRTREIGIRLALGASNAGVMKSVVGHALRIVVLGMAVGVLGALGLSRVLRSILFGVEATNPATYVLVVLTLGLAASLASYLPARRATRVNPRETLVAD